jgi:cell wall-associated NlpC family hydrolase
VRGLAAAALLAVAAALAVPVLVVAVLATAVTGVGGGAVVPVAASPVGAAGTRGLVAAAWALDQLGAPYRWGAAGPDAFDCSGLVLRAWEAAGVILPRVAAHQYGAGAHLPVADAGAGDLVFFADDPADPATIVHVGIALGDGRMVDAPFTGAVVRIDPLVGPGLVPWATRPG